MLIRDRLMDEETFTQRYTPGGFAYPKKAARFMRELLHGKYKWDSTYEEMKEAAKSPNDPEPNYDPTDPSTLMIYNQMNQVAGKLIGIMANENSNHAFCSLLDTFELKTPISLLGHAYKDLIHSPEGVDVDLHVAELLAASVDAVKDPVLNFLNLNTLTGDSAATMIRLGFTPEEVGLFLNQPIIKEACEYAFNNNCDLKSALNFVVNTIQSNNKGRTYPTVDSGSLSKDDLVRDILMNRASAEKGGKLIYAARDTPEGNNFYTRQIAIANTMVSVLGTAKAVSSFVSVTKNTASNALGSTMGSYYASLLKTGTFIEGYDKTLVIRASKELELPVSLSAELDTPSAKSQQESNPMAYEQVTFAAYRQAIEAICKQYYPYETVMYRNAREALLSITKNHTLNADEIDSLHSAIITYLLSGQENSLFNGSELFTGAGTKDDGTYPTNREFFTKTFPETLHQMMNMDPSLKENPLLNNLTFSINETGAISMSVNATAALRTHERDGIMEGWEDLMNGDEPSKFLATSLFLYNFYIGGIGFSPITFMQLCPVSVKEKLMVTDEMSYVDFLNNVRGNGTNSNYAINLNNFLPLFIRNHVDDKNLVTYITKDSAKKYIENNRQQRELHSDGTSDIIMVFKPSEVFYKDSNFKELARGIDEQNGLYYYAPAFMLDNKLYIASGNIDFNCTTGDIVYTMVEPLGINKKTSVYSDVTDIEITNVTEEEKHNTQSQTMDVEQADEWLFSYADENKKLVDNIIKGTILEDPEGKETSEEDDDMNSKMEGVDEKQAIDEEGNVICGGAVKE